MKRPVISKELRAEIVNQRRQVATLPQTLTRSPELEKSPPVPWSDDKVYGAWVSSKFVVWVTVQSEDPLVYIMTVHRTRLGFDGMPEGGITGEEIISIKDEIGFGKWYGIELYYPGHHYVDDHNTHAILLTDRRPSISVEK